MVKVALFCFLFTGYQIQLGLVVNDSVTDQSLCWDNKLHGLRCTQADPTADKGSNVYWGALATVAKVTDDAGGREIEP